MVNTICPGQEILQLTDRTSDGPTNLNRKKNNHTVISIYPLLTSSSGCILSRSGLNFTSKQSKGMRCLILHLESFRNLYNQLHRRHWSINQIEDDSASCSICRFEYYKGTVMQSLLRNLRNISDYFITNSIERFNGFHQNVDSPAQETNYYNQHIVIDEYYIF